MIFLFNIYKVELLKLYWKWKFCTEINILQL